MTPDVSFSALRRIKESMMRYRGIGTGHCVFRRRLYSYIKNLSNNEFTIKLMIELSKSDIGVFQKLWQEETGEDIPPEKAREYAESLVSLVSIALDPRPP